MGDLGQRHAKWTPSIHRAKTRCALWRLNAINSDDFAMSIQGRKALSFGKPCAGVTVVESFDDLWELGKFDEAISGNVRDPYTDMANLRRTDPVQRVEDSAMPHKDQAPVFMV